MLRSRPTSLFWCGLFTAFATGCEPQGPPILTQEAIDLAPNFSIETMDGQQFVLEEHRGKIVVLNFWGTWCPPCIQELPELNQLAITHTEVTVLGIAVRSSESEVEKLRSDLNIEYSLARASTQHPSLSAYGMDSANAVFPTTYVIGPRGDLVVEGIERATDFNELKSHIKPYLSIQK